jgi:hypothetical protein
VEDYFTASYWLNIPYQREYWTGLVYSPGTSPRRYNWTDKGDSLAAQAYQNWGTGEPDNLSPTGGTEDCGVANYSMRSGLGTWGWQDVHCTSKKYPFICRIKREPCCRQRVACLPKRPRCQPAAGPASQDLQLADLGARCLERSHTCNVPAEVM